MNKKVTGVCTKIMLTILITWIYGLIWVGLEYVIDKTITNRLVDNIMLLLFTPIIYNSIPTKSKRRDL